MKKRETERTSISLDATLMTAARQRADNNHNGNLSVYLAKLIERDLAQPADAAERERIAEVLRDTFGLQPVQPGRGPIGKKPGVGQSSY